MRENYAVEYYVGVILMHWTSSGSPWLTQDGEV